ARVDQPLRGHHRRFRTQAGRAAGARLADRPPGGPGGADSRLVRGGGRGRRAAGRPARRGGPPPSAPVGAPADRASEPMTTAATGTPIAAAVELPGSGEPAAAPRSPAATGTRTASAGEVLG